RSAATSRWRWGRTWSTARTRRSRRRARRRCSSPSLPARPAPRGRRRLVLASASPQRRAILERLGVPFTVRAARVRELARGEPARARAARATLQKLSGATHEVLSGLAVLVEGEERTAVARTAVTFRALDERLLEWYLATGEWRGRAGAYAIQGAGAALVRAV